MRPLAVLLAFVSVLIASGHAQDAQPQRFRGGVDLIAIDVSAVDSKGRPVEDLKPGDFVVKVDGKVRPTVSAELVRVERGKPAAARPVDALTSTNQAPQNARRIIVAADQTLITPGSLAPLQRTASQFIERLAADDYAAFVAFPEPGPRVDFTTDKARVRKAMEEIVGQPQLMPFGDFSISLTEALTITNAESIQDKSEPPVPPELTPQRLLTGPAMLRVLERGCRGLTIEDLRNPDNLELLRQCRRDIYNESLRIAAQARLEANISLRALEKLLQDLVPLDGPKTMIIFSAGLVNDDPTVLNEVAYLASAARTSINVVAVDRNREQELRDMPNGQSTLSLVDRSLEMQGLEIIADRTGGTLFRGVASGAGIFERLESELSAWYLVAVARQPGDPDRQRLDVEVKRRGVNVRSNKSVVSARFDTNRPVDQLLSDVLSSPFAIPGVPLRVSTFTQRDASPGKYRLRLAAQIGAPGEPAGEFAVGYILADSRGRAVTTAGSRRTLSPAASGPNQTLQYDTSLAVDPGSYSLRFGVIDKDGRRGTVVHRIELPRFDGVDVPTSDLIVGNLPAEGEALTPRIEPQVTTSELAGYLELYLPETGRDSVSVVLEIAEGESSPALAMETLTLRPGETPGAHVATGFVTATMAPGRYLARAVVRRDGATVKTLSRPFAIVRDPTVVSRPITRGRGVAMSAELKSLTAGYVAGVVNGLANVVAQEDFDLSKPDRKVTSELLLVQYPGSRRDLIPYRDVSHVDSKPVPGREQRLLDLFVNTTERLRERARRIMNDGEAHVPSVFNPMFVLGFLQSDFQSRFELTVSDAGSDWPREVKLVTFVEMGRPTLLRTGAFGDLDAPTRGRAWIEEGTGRVLQTELEIGRGRGIPTMVTKFRLDDKLQVTVPVEMRTQNPDGIALYSNFRRFAVATESAIPTPPSPNR
ncbi:MAG TPA: VWA domain-containing protein [Vicinamibacterales bacterium]|nr:VWA domain-containing protein [Vicinamibacterales bacterium]